MSTYITDSYLYIDSFLMQDLFKFDQQPNEIDSVELRAATGDLHTITRFQKEIWSFSFPKLTQTEADRLRLILSQTGINVLHTVIYSAPGILRKFDSVTPPGYGVNTDIQRIRKKMRCVSWSMPHWENIADMYSCVGQLLES